MTKVDDTVRRNILAYPGIMHNRFDVLHQIFCVLGNGYEWVNGVPVSWDEADGFEPWTPEGERARYVRDYGSEDVLADAYFAAHIGRQIAAQATVVAEIDQRVQDASYEGSNQANAFRELPQFGAIYPQGNSALLMTLPADIDPEWAEAAAQMREVAAQHGWVF